MLLKAGLSVGIVTIKLLPFPLAEGDSSNVRSSGEISRGSLSEHTL